MENFNLKESDNNRDKMKKRVHFSAVWKVSSVVNCDLGGKISVTEKNFAYISIIFRMLISISKFDSRTCPKIPYVREYITGTNRRADRGEVWRIVCERWGFVEGTYTANRHIQRCVCAHTRSARNMLHFALCEDSKTGKEGEWREITNYG
jgi:hypothetical protein